MSAQSCTIILMHAQNDKTKTNKTEKIELI